MSDFVPVISARHRSKAHANLLEGAALCLWLRRPLRSCEHFEKRLVVLIDSAAALGAAAKGRPSSALSVGIRRLAAMALASGIELNVVFVPSAHNPSDAPSRGIRFRRAKDCQLFDATEPCASLGDPSDLNVDPIEVLPHEGLSEHAVATGIEPRQSVDYRLIVGFLDVPAWRSKGLTSPPRATRCVQKGSPTHVQSRDVLSSGERPSAATDSATEKLRYDLGTASVVAVAGPAAAETSQGIRISNQNPTDDALLKALLSRGPVGSSPYSSVMSKPARPRCLELFSGSGRLGSVLESAGWIVERDDLCLNPDHDLLDEKLQLFLLERIASGRYQYIHCGPPCSSFSTARCPAVRTRPFPQGRPDLSALDAVRCDVGNRSGLFCPTVLMLASRFRISATLERPRGSWLFRQHFMAELLLDEQFQLHTGDFCRYGARWTKRTGLLTTGNPRFARVAKLCKCTSPHTILRGRAPSGVPYTMLAQPYPE